ncbi:unnamed protein product [Moneuplotes crassus]|uniref:Uncharacterized protein n=3 Tax=Euplotes crassus TaxID=5936 RepID=A0AAD1UA33_EUPCR|nr:unnamed protein product [Moneuplotes crassus]
MGCSGSTQRPKGGKSQPGKKNDKQNAKKGIKRKRTWIKGGNPDAPVQAAQMEAYESENVQNKQSKSMNSGVKSFKSRRKPEDPNKVAEGPAKKPTAQIVVSDNFNNDDITKIVEEYKGLKDNEVSGNRPKSATLFGKDTYDTEDWSNVLFAIYNKDLRAVRYFIEHLRYHRRLSTRKRKLGMDETIYEAEAFCLIIAISNQDQAILDYLWSMNELWDYEHLKVVLQVIFTRNLWTEGMKILLGSEATQDIYNSLSYAEKKQFMLELFYRYLHYAPHDIKDYIKQVSLESPYSLIAMEHIMTENDPNSIQFIDDVMNYVTVEDYAKMKYEADINFLKDWNAIYTQFIARTDEWVKIAKKVKKFFSSLDSEMEKTPIFKTKKDYEEFLDKIDSAAEEGTMAKLESYVEECGIRNLRRTQTSNLVLLPDMILVDTYWNAIHIALFKGNLDVVKYLLEECRIDAASSVRLAKDKLNVDRTYSVEHEAFSMFLAILDKNPETAEYLWIEHEYYWNHDHLRAVIKLIEEKEVKELAGTILNNKTSHDIFAYLPFDEKIKYMEWLASEDRKYAEIYKKALMQKPYRWAYLIFKAKNIEEIEDDEAKELKKIGDDVKEDEFEIKDPKQLRPYHTFMKNLAKVEEDDEQFQIYKSATKKLVKKPELEEYKAEDSEEKVLTEIDEEDENGEDIEEDESDFEDDEFEFPSNEEICQWAEEGKLKRLQKVVAHKDFIDFNLIKGYENQVTIGEEEYNTELWNPLVFAINKNRLNVVEYFFNEGKINNRLALMDPDKQDVEYHEKVFFDIHPSYELHNVFIPIQNQHLDMFKLVWENGNTIWEEEHFGLVLEKILNTEWIEGLTEFMKSRTSREIFISLPFHTRTIWLDSVVNIYEEADIEDENIKSTFYSLISESPYSLAMAIANFDDDDDMSQYVKKAKGNLKEPEYNFIIFSEEIDTYKAAFEKNGLKDVAEELDRYKAFMQTHYRININSAGASILTPHTKEVELFKKEPRYAHLNLHAIAMTEKNNAIWPLVKDKAALEFQKGHRWDLLSLALFSKNSEVFNSLMKDTKPLTSMIFKLEDTPFSDKKKNEYVSRLQSLIQYSGDIEVLFNATEKHSSMFTFNEVYSMIKNILQNGTAVQVKILNSRLVKSWFAFMSDESKIKLIEEMFDWADENKETHKALQNALKTPLYAEHASDLIPSEKAESESDGEGESDEEGESDDEGESDEAESASEDNASEESDSDDEEEGLSESYDQSVTIST